MSRMTIDYGIDLGTTNSAIAVCKGTEIDVIKNEENSDYTPSVIHIDKRGAIVVGRHAKERLVSDEDNTTGEFKLNMGTTWMKNFKRGGRRLTPPELSAEVLKSLKKDVLKRKNESISAAVITVPAAFDLPQNDATKAAAELAGLRSSPLLQEPVAAAMAYGFQSEAENVFWLVYDLGGGTFDSAVMQVREATIQVVNHVGDNHLGGKLIDWDIVGRLLVPVLAKEYRLSEFTRGNQKWNAAFAKLKEAAEEAKIRLSNAEVADIFIDFLCVDDAGNRIENFEFELRRGELEKIVEPYIRRSINICKKVLAEKRLGPGDIEKILLVGGPTLTPYLRELLQDKKDGLGIRLEFGKDPLTVVASGAAIFASTQRFDDSAIYVPSAKNVFKVDLEYKPVGSDAEPLIAGKVMSPDRRELNGFSIEFINATASTPWRSGKLPLNPNGTFMTNLFAEKGRLNTFEIELNDSKGNKHETTPDKITYTIGLVITDPPLTHTIGIALANNKVDEDSKLLKGTPLPARKRAILKTAIPLRKGQKGEMLRIPIVEGEKLIADRNRRVGELTISSDEVERDVPVGTDVEITFTVDQSRLVTTRAYIPVLDKEFKAELKLELPEPDVRELRLEIRQQKERIEAIKAKPRDATATAAKSVLKQIEEEEIEKQVESLAEAAKVDQGAAHECQKRILDLKAMLDEIEGAEEWPALVEKAREAQQLAWDIIKSHGTESDKHRYDLICNELKSLMESPTSPDVLQQRIDDLTSFGFSVLHKSEAFWVYYFEHLKSQQDRMTDSSMAERWITQGDRAILNGDPESLRNACQQLINLLPQEEQEKVRGYGSTVIK